MRLSRPRNFAVYCFHVNGHFSREQSSLYDLAVCRLRNNTNEITLYFLRIREQSLSMGETGAEGNVQGYEIFLRVMTGV